MIHKNIYYQLRLLGLVLENTTYFNGIVIFSTFVFCVCHWKKNSPVMKLMLDGLCHQFSHTLMGCDMICLPGLDALF